MLVRSAHRGGFRPVALDAFADTDTQKLTEVCAICPSKGTLFKEPSLLEAVEQYAPGYPLVYGSGLDRVPHLLAMLGEKHKIYGNAPEVQRWVHSKRFFTLLNWLGIPYPKTRFSLPHDPQNWLMKLPYSEGGQGVSFFTHDAIQKDAYYQWYIKAPALSSLFLADGKCVKIIGFNTLWTACYREKPFVFVGAINRAFLTERDRYSIQEYIIKMVHALGIKGLNSLDFVKDGSICRVLEINARPSATLALYDSDYPEGLLAWHMFACTNPISHFEPTNTSFVRAFKVVFTPCTLVLPECYHWPDYCVDRSPTGTLLRVGEPFCTVEAEGHHPTEVEMLITQREAALLSKLMNYSL